MVRLLNSPLWRQWEFDPPVFTREEVQGRWKSQLDRFHRLNLLRETTPAGQWWCDECCESHLITYDQHVDERSGFVVCDGGLLPLQCEQTERVKIDTASLLGILFADSRLSIDPIIGERLWSIGRQTIASRSRDLKFVRGIGATENDLIVDRLSRCPGAILFTPSRGSAHFWRKLVPCATIALEEIARETPTGISVDWQAIEEMLTDDHPSSTRPNRSRKKRGTRTAKIEQLRDELKRHLASAADHAIATAENDGGIALLPRPTKTQLAKLAGMSKCDVTRCFDDPTASELRLLWDAADDLEAVLRLRGRSAVAK